MDKKHNRHLLLRRRRHRLTEEDFRKETPTGEEVHPERNNFLVRIRRVIVAILPAGKVTNQTRDANSATNVCSDMLSLAAQ